MVVINRHVFFIPWHLWCC